MFDYKHIEVSQRQPVTLIRLLDRHLLDEIEIQNVGRELFEAIDQADQKHLVLDLSRVELITSEGLGKLIGAQKRIAAKGGKMKLCGVCANIHHVFAVTKLDSLFEVEDTVDTAIAALS
jgi:anti-anti-sigma factor